MSLSLYNDISGLRFWTEDEIELRELAQSFVPPALSKRP